MLHMHLRSERPRRASDECQQEPSHIRILRAKVERAPQARRDHFTPGMADSGLRRWRERWSEVRHQGGARSLSNHARCCPGYDRDIDPRRRGRAARRAGAAGCAAETRRIYVTGALLGWGGNDGRDPSIIRLVHTAHVHRARCGCLCNERGAHWRATGLRDGRAGDGCSKCSHCQGMTVASLHVVNIPRSPCARARAAGHSAPLLRSMPT